MPINVDSSYLAFEHRESIDWGKEANRPYGWLSKKLKL